MKRRHFLLALAGASGCASLPKPIMQGTPATKRVEVLTMFATTPQGVAYFVPPQPLQLHAFTIAGDMVTLYGTN